MKKIIAVLALVVSAGALAQGGTEHSMTRGGHNHNNRGGMMQQMNDLTPEQQAEFNELHAKHRNKMQRSMLDIREINLKIQKEMLTDKPNQKNIDKLVDQKSKLQAQHQKDMLKFRLEMKEKFGIEMMGGMNGNMMGM